MSYFGSCGSLDPHSSFTTFGVSLVTLMRVVTQDSWETVMYACRSEHDLTSPPSVEENYCHQPNLPRGVQPMVF